jgi:hypothetical protein
MDTCGGRARTSRYEPELEYFRFRRSRLLFGDFALTGRLDNTARGSCGLSDAPTAHVSTEVEAGKRGGQATEKYMRSALLVALLALSSQVADAREIRRDAIPEAFHGTWTTSTDVCKDGDKSPIVLSAKSYASPAGSCVVDYVTEIPGRGGAIYSARMHADGMGRVTMAASDVIRRRISRAPRSIFNAVCV